MRIDKMLANLSEFSRKEIKKLAKDGLIMVNGEPQYDTAKHINPDKDSVTLNGEVVVYKEFCYIMMNKPQGVVSATDDNINKTVIDLLDEEYRRLNLFCVGRLDIDTEGLMLLTNDGELAHNMLSPKRHVDKEYFVIVNDEITENDVEKFESGITLDDGYKTLPATLRVLENKNEAIVIIKEGKFHQIKRMFADCKRKVIYLKRTKIGDLILDEGLEPGEFRELTASEELSLGNG